MTTPKPVRRARAAAMSPVRGSEVPWGAAMTRPRQPGWPVIEPVAVVVSKVTGCGAQPWRMTGAMATLIAHEHSLRQRILPFVGEREQHATPTTREPDLPRTSGAHELGPLDPV